MLRLVGEGSVRKEIERSKVWMGRVKAWCSWTYEEALVSAGVTLVHTFPCSMRIPTRCVYWTSWFCEYWGKPLKSYDKMKQAGILSHTIRVSVALKRFLQLRTPGWAHSNADAAWAAGIYWIYDTPDPTNKKRAKREICFSFLISLNQWIQIIYINITQSQR